MPAIYGDLKAASLESLSSNPSSSTAGRIWRNSTDGQIYVDDGTNKRALFRNDNLFVFGTNATAANNIRFHRAGSGILQFVLGSDATAEGSLATNLAQISARVENSTTSTKPSAGASGRLLFLTDTKSLVVDDGTTYQAVGTSVSTNYITNSTAESGTTGWATYADAAANPVDGTGGSATATFTASTSSPLRGVQSFLYTPGALGNGASYDFTIDSADKGRVLQISFDCVIGGTGYTDGLLQVWVYDVANATLIQPAPYQILNASTNSYFKSAFQTASNSTAYRLIVHQSTATSTYTLKFDNVVVGPPSTGVGAYIGPWQSYSMVITGSTTNPTVGTTTTNSAVWRRVGEEVEIAYNLVQTGAGTAGSGTYLFSLPSGLVANTSLLAADTTLAAAVSGSGFAKSSTNNASLSVHLYDSTHLALRPVSNIADAGTSGGIGSMIGASNYPLSTTSGSYSFIARVAVAGWGASQVLSSDTDSRVCAAIYIGNSGQTVTPGTTDITFSTVVKDTHSAWNGTQFKAPYGGFYQCSGIISTTTVPNVPILYVNGSANAYAATANQSTGLKSFSGMVYLNAGDLLSVRFDTGGNVTLTYTFPNHSISIFRVHPGSTAIAASESVNGRYSGTSSAPSSAGTAITFTTKSFDSHSAYSGSTLTIPSPGKYQFNAGTAIAATSWTSGNTATLTINKNGTGVASQSAQNLTAGNNVAPPLSVSDVVQCNAGDTIQVIGQSNAGGTLSYQFTTYFSWSRVGN